jgi:uncharacterized protein YciI
MKYTLAMLILFLTGMTFAQSEMPFFLVGTWKMDDKELYEHWDKLNDQSLKGFSYSMSSGQMVVMEYLNITQTQNEIVYKATVINQNQGRDINFKLTGADNAYVFENPGHDFPKKIVHQKLNETELFVEVSDGNKKGFSYKMKKQLNVTAEKDSTILNPNYDAGLAHLLGADDYGMKRYVWVILKTGTNQTTDQSFISECFRGHLVNINRLADDGLLVVAGPLQKNEKNYRGIFILNVSTFDEAEDLLQTDPAIKEGLLDVELFTWYGSAALPVYLESSDKIWKTKP